MRFEHDLAVTGQFQEARRGRVIGECHTPDLGIPFRRDDDFRPSFDIPIPTSELDPVNAKNDVIVVGLYSCGLVSDRPRPPAL